MRKSFISISTMLILFFSASSATAEPVLRTQFSPLLADPLEPRIAILPRLDEKYLQLDIGTSADLFSLRNDGFAFGIDFATFSLLAMEDSFKFPVDTIDYLFGISCSWIQPVDKNSLPFDEVSARLRIAHISAHFEDGHYDKTSGKWIGEEKSPFGIPFTYSREFINLVLALSSDDSRVYLGYQYLFHTIPDEIGRHSFQAGIELATPGNTYLAADFKLLPEWDDKQAKTNGHRGTWNLQAGWRLAAVGLENVRIACGYSTGISRHGMYFYETESFGSLGLIVDL